MSVVTMLVVPALFLGLLALLLPLLVGTGERDLAWISGTVEVPAGEAEVYRRYLDRHRRHRLVGGLFGGALAVVVGIRFQDRVQLIGAGDGTPLGDVFFCVVMGVIVGALLAETYRLGRARGTAASASLAPREPIGVPGVVRAARIVSGAGLAWGLVTVVVWGGAGAGSAVTAVVGLLPVVIAEATRAAVTHRRRPVETERALRVDGRIRAFAGRTTSWLQLSAATLVTTWVVAVTPLREGSVAEGLLIVPVLAGLVASVVVLRRASPRPPRRWRPAPLAEAA